MLDFLKDRGIKLYALSNTLFSTKEIDYELRKIGLREYFDDIDEVYFHKIIFKDSSMENDGIIYYATDNVDLWYFSLVELDSRKPIRTYKTKVQNYEGKDVLVVYGLKTSVFGSLFGRKDTISKVNLVDTNGIEGVYLKKGNKLEKIDF